MSENMSVKLPSVDAVRKFVNVVTKMSGDFDLVCGNRVVDAKSFLGVLSLDLDQCLTLKAMDVSEQDAENLRSVCAEFS